MIKILQAVNGKRTDHTALPAGRSHKRLFVSVDMESLLACPAGLFIRQVKHIPSGMQLEICSYWTAGNSYKKVWYLFTK